jgi:predicted hydrocarbon binding protein
LGKQKESVLHRYFDVDTENGTIKRIKGGQRVMVIGSVGWAMLQQELASTFGPGAAVILQRMGYSDGRYLGRVARQQGYDEKGVLAVLLEISKEAGWGKLSLNSGDINGQAHLVVKDCYFCLHLVDAPDPVCHMMAGVVGGVADELTGKTHRVIEGSCKGKGDAACEIIMERIT